MRERWTGVRIDRGQGEWRDSVTGGQEGHGQGYRRDRGLV